MQAIKRLKELLKKMLNNKVFLVPLAAIAIIFPRILNRKTILYPLLVIVVLILTIKITDDFIEYSNIERNYELAPTLISTKRAKLIGASVVIEKNGYILTAAHLVDDDTPTEISINIENNEIPVKILARDTTLDLMALKANHHFSREVPIRTEKLTSWEKVYSISCPFGVCHTYVEGNFFLDGNSTEINSFSEILLFNLHLSGGSSGGGIFDENGNLVSIYSWTYAQNKDFPSNAIGPSIRIICNFLDENRIPYRKARYLW
ncbi:MAG: serine protease [Patescibacteria group bacterium]|nr:serine protease [Patescibacteria group bacterium]